MSSTGVISCDRIKKNEIIRVCGTYGEEKWCTQDFGGETWRK